MAKLATRHPAGPIIAPNRTKKKSGGNMKIGKFVPALLCAGLSMTTPAWADTRDDVLAGVQRCSVMHDDRVWLDCVYGAQQPMRAHLGLSPAPEFQQRLVPVSQPGMVQPDSAPLRPVVRPGPRKKPGFFETLVGDAPPVAVSRMASYRYEKTGAFVVALENGQEWRQTDVNAGSVSWDRSPSTYSVTIAPAAFGSNILRIAGSPRAYKVEQVR
jgi:hypothetical protein